MQISNKSYIIWPAFLIGSILFNFLNLTVKADEQIDPQTLLITEIAAYEPSNLEWIEIYNPSNEDLNITDLKLLENETAHSINSENLDLIIPSQTYAIIANKVDILISEHGFDDTELIFDSTWSSLSLSGETLELSLNEEILDSINFPPSTENTSLERIWQNNQYTNNFQHHPDSNTILQANSTYTPECNPENENCNPEPEECDPISVIETIYLEKPILLISEVSFKDQNKDWIEIFIDPKEELLDLNNYYLKIDSHQIPLGTETINSPTLFTLKTNLVATTEQIQLVNDEQIFDTICWVNDNPSSSEQEELNEILNLDQWHEECLNSTLIDNNQSFSRQNFFSNQLKASDWQISYHSTPNEFNYQINQNPTAKINIQSGNLTSEEKITINLDGSTSSDPDNDKLTYQWFLDSKIFSDKENPNSLEITEIGLHNITLKVSDPYLSTSNSTIYLEVLEKSDTSQTDDSNENTSSNTSNSSTSSNSTSTQTEDNFQFIDGDIIIHSFLANPEGADSGKEWIKLQNLDTKSINLKNWILDDIQNQGSQAFTIPEITLAPQEIYTFLDTETKIILNNGEDEINLLKPNQELKEQIIYSNIKENEIFNKNVASSQSSTLDQEIEKITKNIETKKPSKKKPTKKSTKKSSKKTKTKLANGDLNNVLKISELFVNPKGKDKNKEWIEIYNPSKEQTNLNNWTLKTETKEFVFENITLEAESYTQITLKDFSLSNQASQLTLNNFKTEIIDQVYYEKSQEDKSYSKINQEWYWTNLISPNQANPELVILEGELQNLDLENQIINLTTPTEETFQITYPSAQISEQFNPEDHYYLKLEAFLYQNQYILFQIKELEKIIKNNPTPIPIIPLTASGAGLIPIIFYKKELLSLGQNIVQKYITN